MGGKFNLGDQLQTEFFIHLYTEYEVLNFAHNLASKYKDEKYV